MKEIVRRVSLDLSRKSNACILFSSQSDMNSRVFLISLFDDGIPYAVSRTLTAAVNILRSDETSASFIAEITDDGNIKYTAGAWALGVSGLTRASVSLYDGDGIKLTSSHFSIDIVPGLYLGDDINGNDEAETAFSNMMSHLAQINEEMLSGTKNASDAAAAANKAALDASGATALASSAASRADAATQAAAEAAEMLDEALEDMIIRPISKGGTGASTAQGAVQNLKDYIFPVGALYLSIQSKSPAEIMGGVWERIKDRFLLSAGDSYAAGATGGEAAHVLTNGEMPSHNHLVSTFKANSGGTVGRFTISTTWSSNVSEATNDMVYTGRVQNSGSGNAHNNMPPYLAVYMWKRIA